MTSGLNGCEATQFAVAATNQNRLLSERVAYCVLIGRSHGKLGEICDMNTLNEVRCWRRVGSVYGTELETEEIASLHLTFIPVNLIIGDISL